MGFSGALLLRCRRTLRVYSISGTRSPASLGRGCPVSTFLPGEAKWVLVYPPSSSMHVALTGACSRVTSGVTPACSSSRCPLQPWVPNPVRGPSLGQVYAGRRGFFPCVARSRFPRERNSGFPWDSNPRPLHRS